MTDAQQDNETEASEQVARAAVLDKLKNQFFTGEKGLTAAGTLIAEIQEAGIPLKMNYDPEKVDFPGETHGLLVQVLKHRVNKKTVPTGEVLVAAVPTVEAVGESGDAGKLFLMEAVEGILASRVVNAVRAGKDGNDPFVPFTIDDFITKRTITSEYGDYSKLAKTFVSALKKYKGFEVLNPTILRNMLMSTEMAKSLFPTLPQSWWEGVLAKMIEHAGASTPKLDTAIFETWLSTRDEVSSSIDVSEMNLDDLSLGLTASDDDADADADADADDETDGE